jgi:hypothetical protein
MEKKQFAKQDERRETVHREARYQGGQDVNLTLSPSGVLSDLLIAYPQLGVRG